MNKSDMESDDLVNCEHSTDDNGKWSRREFLAGSAVAGVGLVLAETSAEAIPAQTGSAVVPEVPLTLNVNGKDVAMKVEPRVSLLDALRERAGLTGTKKGCDHGQCGACTVHIDGRRVLSCLSLAIMHQGHKVTTIEGLAQGEILHAMQAAFIKYDGYQCGFCTPGQIMSAVALVAEGNANTDDDIREGMSGNICRCGAYPNIVAAVREVAGNNLRTEGKSDATL